MKALLVGLVFLIAACLLTGIGILLFPFLIVLAFFLRFIVGFLLVMFAIWLLGKFIIYVWDNLKDK